MLTAEEMLQYSQDNRYGVCLSKEWSLKHFQVITDSLMDDEEVHMSFLSLGNLIHTAKHETQSAYTITNERMLIGQKKRIGADLRIIPLDDIEEIESSHNFMRGVINMDTTGGRVRIDVPKESLDVITEELKRIVFEMRFRHETIKINFNKPIHKDEQPVVEDSVDTSAAQSVKEPIKKELEDSNQLVDSKDVEIDASIPDSKPTMQPMKRVVEKMFESKSPEEEKELQSYKSLLKDGIITKEEYDHFVNKE